MAEKPRVAMKTTRNLPALSLDRISFTFQVNKQNNKKVVSNRIKTLMERANNSKSSCLNVRRVKFLGENKKGSYKYHQNYMVELNSGWSYQAIFVSIYPLEGSNNFLRVELNPSHYNAKGQKNLQQLFDYLFGTDFTNRMYEECVVTKVDLAVDLPREIDFVMSYPRINTSSMRYLNGKLLEQTLGGARGRTSIKAYNKLEERLQRGAKVNKAVPWTRIELRLRDQRCSISELDSLTTPFEKLKFYPWDMPEYMGQQFVRLVHSEGLPGALKTRRPEIRELIKQELRGLEISLFNSDDIHRQWPQALRRLDFLKPKY